MTLPPELASALLSLVERCVDERLRALGVTTLANEYTAENLPPRTNRRAFFAACRSGKVDGAVRDGRGWRCGVQAWAAFRARGPEMPVRGCAAKSANVVNIDELLRASGMRGTR